MNKKTEEIIKHQFKMLEANRKFMADIRNIRKKLGILAKGRNGKNVMNIKALSKKEIAIARDFIDNKLKEYNLPVYFRDFLEEYIGRGDFAFGEQRQIKISSRVGRNGQGEIILKFFSDTTTKDIQSIWHLVEQEQKKLVGQGKSRKMYKNLERDTRIDELHKNGLSYKSIAKQIYEEFGGKKLFSFEIGGILRNFRLKTGQKRGFGRTKELNFDEIELILKNKRSELNKLSSNKRLK